MSFSEEPRFRISFDDSSPKGVKFNGTVKYKSDKITISETQDSKIEPVKGNLGLRLLSLYLETRKDFEDSGFQLYQKKIVGDESS